MYSYQNLIVFINLLQLPVQMPTDITIEPILPLTLVLCPGTEIPRSGYGEHARRMDATHHCKSAIHLNDAGPNSSIPAEPFQYSPNAMSYVARNSPKSDTPCSSLVALNHTWISRIDPMAPHEPPYPIESTIALPSRCYRLNSWLGVRHDSLALHMEERYHRFRPSDLEYNELAPLGRHPYQQQRELPQLRHTPSTRFALRVRQWVTGTQPEPDHPDLGQGPVPDEYASRLAQIPHRTNSSDLIVAPPAGQIRAQASSATNTSSRTPGALAFADFCLDYDKHGPPANGDLSMVEPLIGSFLDECLAIVRQGRDTVQGWFRSLSSFGRC